MKKFVFKILAYLAVALVALELICSFLVQDISLAHSLGIKSKFMGQLSILNRTKEGFVSDTLHIGDSVARQVFQGKGNTFTSHAGILAEGNYILLKNVIRHNPQLKVVLYGVTPTTLSFDFDESVTSLNYIKPYQSIYNLRDLDLHSVKHMARKPLSLLYLFNFGKYLPISDIDFKIEKTYRKNLSQHSFIYTLKMMDLCKKHGLEFVMYCPPINQKRVDVTNNFQEVKGRVYKTRLEPLFNRYFRTVIVMGDDYFRDGQHFKNPRMRKERKSIQSNILKKIKDSKFDK